MSLVAPSEPRAGDAAAAGGVSRRPRRRRPLRRLLLLALLAALGYGGWLALTWPDVAALAEENPTTTAFVQRARRAARRAERPEPRILWVPYAQISPHLKRAVLAAEDIGFFDHDGFAWEELEIAVRAWWQEDAPLRGASTLSQQVAKNLWLSPSRNPLRKLREGLLTWQLERHLDKRRIFEIYLNVVELGPGVFGAEAAARHYYGKGAGSLSEGEAAALAAGLSRPSQWHPGVGSRGYQRQVERIRGRMARAQWLWKVI